MRIYTCVWTGDATATSCPAATAITRACSNPYGDTRRAATAITRRALHNQSKKLGFWQLCKCISQSLVLVLLAVVVTMPRPTDYMPVVYMSLPSVSTVYMPMLSVHIGVRLLSMPIDTYVNLRLCLLSLCLWLLSLCLCLCLLDT